MWENLTESGILSTMSAESTHGRSSSPAELLSPTASEVLDAICEALSDCDDDALREAVGAFEELATRDGSREADRLVARLAENEEPDSRRVAAFGVRVVAVQQRRFLSETMSTLLGDPNPDVANAACVAMTEILDSVAGCINPDTVLELAAVYESAVKD